MSLSQTQASANPLRDRAEEALRGMLYGEAEGLLEKALEQNPQDPRTLMLLGDLSALKYRNAVQSIGFYMMAVSAEPANLDYKKRFITLTGEISSLTQFNPLLKSCLVECLQTPEIDCTDAQRIWYLTFSTDPAYLRMFKVRPDGGGTNRALIHACKNFAPILDRFFYLALERMVVYNPAFEDFLTGLRHALLHDLTAPTKRFGLPYVRLAAALAQYCFATEYIFALTDDEKQKAIELRARVEAGMASEMEIAVAACYTPLYRMANTSELETKYAASPALGGIVRAQITDYYALIAKRDKIPALTDISPGMSEQVRAQYEEFPYPRWTTIRDLLPYDLFRSVAGKRAKILVAGGGTGNEAATIARAVPDADILSIDLSRMSLAYGAVKAGQFGLKNVVFRQADILMLDTNGEKFDIVSSTGVLVCMKDPMQGWRILVNMMKPDGLMRISLYSEAARAAVVKSRQVIAKHDIPGTADGMRAFRTNIDSYIGKEEADLLRRNCADFYHMSMLKDLLFHVQEHRFTIPQIRKALGELGLEFISFVVPMAVMAGYAAAFPEDTGGGSLDNWEEYEKKHPDAFLYMYQFWCKKKA
jgi:2-polyprenyl-3-methyl-5-hydroxy-6-metoxy-1,4-benzoquinol methylase